MADEPPRPRPEPDHAQRWVVGVDGSECSRHAALWASANVENRASELQLASAWSMPVSMAPNAMAPMITASTIDALEAGASATVSNLACSLSSTLSIPITATVGRSGAAALLLDAAHHCDLVVVGSRGLGGFARLMLGSTSTQCATHSSAPVAVIPMTAPVARPRSMVVAFDGSPNSVDALEWAMWFADAESEIDCVFVWDTTPISVGSDQFFFPEASDLARERFEHIVSDVTRAHRRTDIRVRSVFVEGAPRATLAAATASCDLLVMGARGHGAIGAAVLGSVSTWLLHHVNQAIVVVPHRQLDDPNDGEVGDHVEKEED